MIQHSDESSYALAEPSDLTAPQSSDYALADHVPAKGPQGRARQLDVHTDLFLDTVYALADPTTHDSNYSAFANGQAEYAFADQAEDDAVATTPTPETGVNVVPGLHSSQFC